MTNEELKKKIVEVVLNSEITGIQIRAITGGYSMANNIADALITAGLCDKNTLDERYQTLMAAGFVQLASLRLDLEKVLHRAEVAERALLLACANVVKDEKDDVDIELLVRVVYDKYLKQAEQLAEERKDEQS